MEKNADIENIIAKFLAGEASPEEAIQLEEWKELSKDNEVYFSSCEKLFYANENPAKITDAEIAWEKVSPQLRIETKVVDLKSNRSTWNIAASIAILISISVYLFYNFGNQGQFAKTYQAQNEILNISLEDSTKVQIAPHANITLSEGYGKNNRLIKLKGDAYFEVIHNTQKPFIVDVGSVFIKDVGTKFKVANSRNSDTVHVHVDEGVVLLFDSAGTEITITAKQHAMYIRSTKQVISDAASIVPIKLVFDKTRLIDVVKLLSEKYDMSINLSNTNIHNCLLTASFNDENIETVLTIISETLGFSFSKTDTGYLIVGKQCQ